MTKTSKTLSFTIIVAFLLNSTVLYGVDLPGKSHLRAPMMSGSTQGKRRIIEATEGVSGENTTNRLQGFTKGDFTDKKVAAANWALAKTVVPDEFVLQGVYLDDHFDSRFTERDIENLKIAAKDKVRERLGGRGRAGYKRRADEI